MTAPDPESDAVLIGRIVNGDADAVRPLIERYQRPLAALLRRGLGTLDVDDMCQETWIRVVRGAGRYDPAYPFRSWLFAIAWNELRDHWARQKRNVPLDENTPVAASAEDLVIASDEARRVRELVWTLPERLAQAILLRYFEELSEKEMAARLGVPVGTVKSRLHTGLRRLAEAMGEKNS